MAHDGARSSKKRQPRRKIYKVSEHRTVKGPWTRPPPPLADLDLANGKSKSKNKKSSSSSKAAVSAAQPSLDSISDEAVSNILGRISDAKQLARCASVCRRWRRIAKQAPVVKLELRKMRAWQAEGVISQALLDRRGLRDFELRFICSRRFPMEGVRESRLFACLWRLCSTIEALSLFCPGTIYFKLWTWLAKFPNLQLLRIDCGRIEELPVCGTFQHLMKCEFTRTIISAQMLEILVRYSPVLEHLLVVGCDPIESLSLRSTSLKSVNIVANADYPMSRLELHSSNLSELSICHIQELHLTGEEMQIACLGIYSACLARITSSSSLTSLEIHGNNWDMEAVEHLISSAQNAERLILKASIKESKPIRLEHYLSVMFRLQTLVVDGNMLECFCDGLEMVSFQGVSPAFSLKKIAIKVASIEAARCIAGLLAALLGCCPELHFVAVNDSVKWEEDMDRHSFHKTWTQFQDAKQCRITVSSHFSSFM